MPHSFSGLHCLSLSLSPIKGMGGGEGGRREEERKEEGGTRKWTKDEKDIP